MSINIMMYKAPMKWPRPHQPYMKVKKFYNGGSFMLLRDYGHHHLNYFHRTDGHAVELSTGEIFFYIKNEIQVTTHQYCEAAGMDGEETLYWVLKYGDTLPRSIE